MPLRFSTVIKITLFEGGFKIELHCVCAITILKLLICYKMKMVFQPLRNIFLLQII